MKILILQRKQRTPRGEGDNPCRRIRTTAFSARYRDMHTGHKKRIPVRDSARAIYIRTRSCRHRHARPGANRLGITHGPSTFVAQPQTNGKSSTATLMCAVPRRQLDWTQSQHVGKSTNYVRSAAKMQSMADLLKEEIQEILKEEIQETSSWRIKHLATKKHVGPGKK